MSRRLRVSLHGEEAGELVERESGRVDFRFSSSYIERPERPVLGQLFEDDLTRVYHGDVREPLPSFFTNLLPEGRLRWLLEERSRLPARDDLGLLAFLGDDLPGAVSIHPLEGESFFEGRTEAPERAEGEDPLRFSLAGVQLKFSVVRSNDKLTLPARGAEGHFIVKLHGPELPGLAENEYSMMAWARAAGFSVAPAELVPLSALQGIPLASIDEASRALVVQRYDRTPEGRVHQEDFAQVVGLSPSKKYEHLKHETLGALIRAIAGEEELYEFIRRLAFIVASGNGDAHAKNWSLYYPDKIRGVLSPLYDQVFTGAYPVKERIAGKARARVQKLELALKLASVKRMSQVDRESFRRLGERIGVDGKSVEDVALEMLDLLRSTFREVGSALPLYDEHREMLERHWAEVPLLRELGPLH